MDENQSTPILKQEEEITPELEELELEPLILNAQTDDVEVLSVLQDFKCTQDLAESDRYVDEKSIVSEPNTNQKEPELFSEAIMLAAMVDFLPRKVGHNGIFTLQDGYAWLGNPLSRKFFRYLLYKLTTIGFLSFHSPYYRIAWELNEVSSSSSTQESQ